MPLKKCKPSQLTISTTCSDLKIKSVENGRRPECVEGYVNIGVPSGIGDVTWALAKVEAIGRAYKDLPVCIHIQESPFDRSTAFVSSFSFVAKTRCTKFGLHPPEGPFTNAGPYLYYQSGRNQHGFDYLLIPNNDLERGLTVEEWLPDLQTRWDIGDRFMFTAQAVECAASLGAKLQNHYVVFYLGPKAGNWAAGFNRENLWPLDYWRFLGSFIHEHSGWDIVLVGAEMDTDYTENLWRRLTEHERTFYHNICGKTSVPEVFAIAKASKLVVGFPSGIPIFSSYLKVPTVMFMRPYGNSITGNRYVTFDNKMGWNALHKPTVEGGKAFVAFFGQDTPESVSRELQEREMLW